MTETLVELNDGGDPEPGVASSFEQVHPRPWRFAVHDVTVHDGTDLTVERVVDSLRRAAAASPQPWILDGVELSIAPDGDEAALISTADPDPLLLNRLSSPSWLCWPPVRTPSKAGSTRSAQALVPSC